MPAKALEGSFQRVEGADADVFVGVVVTNSLPGF